MRTFNAGQGDEIGGSIGSSSGVSAAATTQAMREHASGPAPDGQRIARHQPVAASSSDPVEQAYREGKFPKSRIGHYRKLYAKKPNKTKKTLASLAPLLPTPEDQELLDAIPNPAPVAAAPSGPTEYPKEWLDRGGVIGQASGAGGNVIEEPGLGGAAMAGPGEVL